LFPSHDHSVWFPKDEYLWEVKEFAKAAAASKGKKQNMGEELLIMNYEVNKKIILSGSSKNVKSTVTQKELF